MCKFGWNWTSVRALEAYRLLLVDSAFCNGSFAASEHLSSLIELADEIVRLEGCMPRSFKVAVDLGTIYSAAAVNNAHDARESDAFIVKANDAWCIASTHLQNDAQRDAALVEPGALRATYLGGYWQIPCEMGFARYLQTNCTDVSHLRALKKHWLAAKQERPNHPILLDIGEHIAKRLSAAEYTEHRQERSPSLASPAIAPAPQRTQRLRIGAVMIVIAALTGLMYVYRPERAREPQHDTATHVLRTSSDPAISIAPEPTSAGPGNQPPAIEPSRDTEQQTISDSERSAEATPASQEPTSQHQRDGNLPSTIAELQQGAATPDAVAETAARNRSSARAATQAGSRDVEKAAHLERQGMEALVAGDFTAAQRLFQASENAATGFHYSYEWARLLQARQAEFATPARRKEVLQFALSKGYASRAPSDIRDKLRQLAQ